MAALGVTVGLPDLAAAFRGLEGEHAAALTEAMVGATGSSGKKGRGSRSGTLKDGLRRQVTDAGLGARLANTWQAEVYPSTGISLDPAGWAYSNAPDIITAFSAGANIVPLNGKKYLWIPTKRVPRGPGGRYNTARRLSPEQLLASLGLDDFIIRKGRGGRLLAFVSEGRKKTKRGALRKVRKGMLAHGSDGQLVLMFTLTPAVKIAKRFDLQEMADFAAADFVERYEQAVR